MTERDRECGRDPDVERSLAEPDVPASFYALMLDYLAGGTDRGHVMCLLDAYRAHRDWELDFERSLTQDMTGKELSRLVQAMIADGADRTALRYRLEAFALQLRDQDREPDDDVVLEVLDRLMGWGVEPR